MSTTATAGTRPPRRVRHHVRDGVAVMALSATVSCGLAVAMLAFLSAVG
jgi:hypothetical protein